MNSAAREYSIFLSYAHQDEAWVAEFAEALRAENIYDYWFDHEAIAVGDLWTDTIQVALRQSDTFIVFLSPDSLENPNVFFEVGAAVANNKRIIPVLIGNIDQRRIPLSLATRRWLRADSPQEAAKQVAQIISDGANP